jgi:hypothetical protein
MNTLLTQDIASVSWSKSVKIDGDFHFLVSGTWSGTFSLQTSKNNAEWLGFFTTTANTDKVWSGEGRYFRFGFQTSSYTSGTATGTLYQTDSSIISDIITLTADTTLTTAELGKSIRVNSASSVTLTFPSVDAANDGAKLRVIKINSGNVVLQMVDSDKIGSSSATGTCTNSTAAETFAWLDLEYVHAAVTWIMTGHGSWVTA